MSETNEDMLSETNKYVNDIIKIIKSLEYSCVLIDGVTKTVEHEENNFLQISWSFVTTFNRLISATSNFFSTKKYK